MNVETFYINLDDQEVLVRVSEVVVPGVRVSASNFGNLQVMGGIPGPPGLDGVDGLDGLNGDVNPTLLFEHIDAVEPHPAYDDLPSFTLIFENGLI